MAVSIKLARHGVKRNAFYRIVAAPHGAKRDGRFIEVIGTYDPNHNPPKISFKEDKLKKWVGVGAQLTGTARSLIIKSFPGLIEEREKHQLNKIQAARKKRKQRAQKGASKKK